MGMWCVSEEEEGEAPGLIEVESLESLRDLNFIYITDKIRVYMAHSSPSSASEMNGSSIALMARSPQRMLIRKIPMLEDG